jgi:hypothetical protein
VRPRLLKPDKLFNKLRVEPLRLARRENLHAALIKPNDDSVGRRTNRCVVESCGRHVGLGARYVRTSPIRAAAAVPLATASTGTVVPRPIVELWRKLGDGVKKAA